MRGEGDGTRAAVGWLLAQMMDAASPLFPTLLRLNAAYMALDGGAGSGNFGHSGRPGQVGGSGPSGSSGLTSKGKSGKLQSSQKVIGKNGGTLRAEDMPKIVSSKGSYRVVPGTKVDGIYTFAGAGAKSTLRVESTLIRQYGGTAGQWQHTAGNAYIAVDGGVQKVHIHWFQEPSVGIVRARVKEC